MRDCFEACLLRLRATRSRADPAISPATGRSASSQPSLRLLLTEVDDPVTTAVARGVRWAGWSVLRAAMAAEALQLKAEFAPYVMLLALDLRRHG